MREEKPRGTLVAVRSLTEFRSNFDRDHPTILDRLNDILLEEKVVIAGGSVLQALTSSPGVRTAEWWGKTWRTKKSDVDIFLYCKTPREATRVAGRIFFALVLDGEAWIITRNGGVITIHNGSRNLEVQIILRLYDSPEEVLIGFDCDCCCCAYDGHTVWATPRCVQALVSGTNILNPLHSWPNKSSYECRLGKYAYRGYSVLVPGFSRKHVDHERIQRTEDSKLRGLSRLLVVTSEMETQREHGDHPRAPDRIPRIFHGL